MKQERRLTKPFELGSGGGVVAGAVLEVGLDDLLLRQDLAREALAQGEQHGLAPGALLLLALPPIGGAPADDPAAGHRRHWSPPFLLAKCALLLL